MYTNQLPVLGFKSKRIAQRSLMRINVARRTSRLTARRALRDPTTKLILPELGKRKNASNEKAKRVLGWRLGAIWTVEGQREKGGVT